MKGHDVVNVRRMAIIPHSSKGTEGNTGSRAEEREYGLTRKRKEKEDAVKGGGAE